MPGLERRCTRNGLPVDVQSRADGKPVIVGYAAVFYNATDPGTEYRLYDDLVERFMPGAFDRALREDDVRGLFNHDASQILGRVKAGTMRLSVDKRGLRYEIDPPDTTFARDLLESIRRGDVSGSSIIFRPKSNTYRQVDGTYIIERDDVYLYDAGPVCFPAYEATDAAVRSGADKESVRREVEEWAKQSQPASAAYLAMARAVEITMNE